MLSRWLSHRSFLRAPFGDARTVIAVVLGLLLATLTLFRQTAPEAALFRLLRDLPPEVRMVLLEPASHESSDGTSNGVASSKDLVVSILQLPPAGIPSAVPLLATLVIEDASGGEKTVSLVEQSVVQQFGLSGVEVGGLIAVGDKSQFFADRLRERRNPVSTLVLRELRAAPGVRVLVRPAWIMRRFPLFPRTTEEDMVGLWVQGDSSHVRVEGILPHGNAFGVRTRRLLTTRPENALLVLDGIPVSALLPADLPPLLEALRTETGVGSEIRALTEILRDAPLFVVVQPKPDGVPVITVGATFTEEHQKKVETVVQDILVRRLAISRATVETIRSNSRVIRHARPAAANGGVEETRDGPGRVLRALRAAGAHDLVAEFRDGVVMLGTSRESLRDVGSVLRPTDTRDAAMQFFLDGALLRRIPAVTFALQGLPPRLRSWAERFENLHTEMIAESRHVRMRTEIEWFSSTEVP